ncbi:hypothetical protein Bbelb_152910 [Branchiostoma belcheri]|nr:hypothetical protein Bbelb_152910 [Branchiostoma belcheri]
MTEDTGYLQPYLARAFLFSVGGKTPCVCLEINATRLEFPTGQCDVGKWAAQRRGPAQECAARMTHMARQGVLKKAAPPYSSSLVSSLIVVGAAGALSRPPHIDFPLLLPTCGAKHARLTSIAHSQLSKKPLRYESVPYQNLALHSDLHYNNNRRWGCVGEGWREGKAISTCRSRGTRSIQRR